MLAEQVQQAFPWWDMLHEWWSKHLKHSIGLITNSNPGAATRDLKELVEKDDMSAAGAAGDVASDEVQLCY
jgi:hypothetical protein